MLAARTFTVCATLMACMSSMAMAHNDASKEHAKVHPSAADKFPTVSYEEKPEFEALKSVVTRVSELKVNNDLTKLVAGYFRDDQTAKMNAFLEGAKVLHKNSGNSMIAAFRIIGDLTHRLPASADAVKGATESDKKILGRLIEFKNKYTSKFAELAVKEDARYRNIEREFGSIPATFTHTDKATGKTVTKDVSKAYILKKEFVCEQVDAPETVAVAVFDVLVSAFELSEDCKELYPLRADLLSKVAAILFKLEGASKDSLRTPLRDAAVKFIPNAESLASHYFPLYSSMLFWTLVSIVVAMLIGIAASVMVYSH